MRVWLGSGSCLELFWCRPSTVFARVGDTCEPSSHYVKKAFSLFNTENQRGGISQLLKNNPHRIQHLFRIPIMKKTIKTTIATLVIAVSQVEAQRPASEVPA